jgi:hypothetical protein
MSPFHLWLLYVESAKTRGELYLDYVPWLALNGFEVKPDGDDAA